MNVSIIIPIHKYNDEIQKITDDFINDVNEIGERKEVEVMEV